MPLFPREERDIVNEALASMNSNTNITQMSPGAKARFFLATTAKEQSRAYQQFDSNLLQPYIRYSSGKFLDFFGDMLNLPRYEATHAFSTNDNFMFYVQSGKFGDINGGSTFSIPAGTQVSTLPFEGEIVSPGLDAQPVITYATTEECVCAAETSYAYVPVRSLVEGDESSVPRNTLNDHSFSGYSLSSRDLLLCTNRFAIDNGVNRESDDSYRYRLANLFKARMQAIEISIRLAALSVPGVSDVTIINAEQGPGSFGIYIQGITPTVSPQLVTSVTWAVQQVAALGIRPFISEAIPLGIELVAAVNWSPRAKKEEIASGYTNMRNGAEQFINRLKIGQSLDLDELIEQMLSFASKANQIGQAAPNTFEEVYLYRQSPTGTGSTRNLAIGTIIEPLYNQRIILETGNRFRGIQFITF